MDRAVVLGSGDRQPTAIAEIVFLREEDGLTVVAPRESPPPA